MADLFKWALERSQLMAGLAENQWFEGAFTNLWSIYRKKTPCWEIAQKEEQDSVRDEMASQSQEMTSSRYWNDNHSSHPKSHVTETDQSRIIPAVIVQRINSNQLVHVRQRTSRDALKIRVDNGVNLGEEIFFQKTLFYVFELVQQGILIPYIYLPAEASDLQ